MWLKKSKNNFSHCWALIFIFSIISLGIYFFLKQHTTSSQTNISVGLLNGDRIWTQLPAVKHLKEELNVALKNHHKKFSRLEEELRKENQELLQLQQTLTAENKAQRSNVEQRQKAFSIKVMQLQKQAEETQKKVNDLYEQSMIIIKDKVNQTIKKVARKKDLSLVLYDNQIAYHDGSLDITDDVFNDLKEFQYPSLKW
jgi:Skp family chaperone for outer membrane proteins